VNQIASIPGFLELTNNDLGVDILLTREATIVLKLKGFIDTYNTPFFSKKVNMAITHGFSYFIFDMQSVNYMSSTAIGIFTSFLKVLKPINGDIIFVGVNPKVYDVFELIGFSSFFTFTNDMTNAMKLVKPSKRVERKPEISVFPKRFRCSCKKVLKVSRAGQFQCPQCKTRISVSTRGSLKKVLT